MKFVTLPVQPEGAQIYGRVDDDGLCRMTCTAEHPEFQEWVTAGNEPVAQTPEGEN